MQKTMLLALAIICLCGVYVVANENFLQSKTNEVSAGIFSEEQDKYLDVLDFSELNKNLLFLSLGMPSTTITDTSFEIGTGNNLGSIYLGTHFDIDKIGKQGNLVANESIQQTSTIAFNENGAGIVISKTTDTMEEIDFTNNLDLGADLLFGIGNIGIRAGYASDSTSQTATFNNAYATSTSTTTSVEDTAGNLISESVVDYEGGFINNKNHDITIGAGMPLQLGDLTLGLTAGVELSINNDDSHNETKTYTVIPNTGYATYMNQADVQARTDVEEDHTESYLGITHSIGANIILDTPLLSGSELEIDFSYSLGLRLNNNETDDDLTTTYTTDATTVPGIISTTLVELKYDKEDTITYQNHVVSPTFTLRKDFGDRVKVGISYNPSFTMNKTETVTEESTVTTTTNEDGTAGTTGDSIVVATTTEPGITNTTSSFNFDNVIGIAAQFMLNEKIRINAGASVTTPTLVSKSETVEVNGVQEMTSVTYDPDMTGTATTTSYSYSSATTSPSQTGTNTNIDFSAVYNAGLTFFFNENMKLDMIVDMSGNTYNIFAFDSWTAEFTFSY